jgi:hypothetical protein
MDYYADEYDDLYEYDTLETDSDYIEEDMDEYSNDDIDDGIEAWENYYHNIADEINEDLE